MSFGINWSNSVPLGVSSVTVLFRPPKLCAKRAGIPGFHEFLGYVILVRMTTCFGTLVLSWQQLSFARREAVGFFKVVRCHKSVVFLYFTIMLSRFSLLTCKACFDRCEGIVCDRKTLSILTGRFLGDVPEGHFTPESCTPSTEILCFVEKSIKMRKTLFI